MPRFGLLVALSAIVVGMTNSDVPAARQTGLAPGLIAFEHEAGREPNAIYMMNPDGSGKRFLAVGSWARWSPDGNQLAFVQLDAPVGLYVIKRDGTGLRRLVARFVTSPTWSPDGRQIAFWTSSGLAVISTAAGRVRRLTRGEDENPVWSPTENRIAFMRWQGDRFAIATVNADGTQVGVLTPASYNAHNPTWSPDGRRLAFNGNFGDIGDWDIYAMNGDGSALTNLTQTDAPSEEHPQWSPNAQWIAFASTNPRRYDPDIHTIRSNGSRHRNLTRSPRSRDVDVSWSPDGKSLVFSSLADGNGDIYVMSVSGRNVANLTNDPKGTANRNPAWSP